MANPAMSVANQIRKSSLGVKTGGTQGRLATVHKGVGLNQNSGGINSKGSGAKPYVPARNPVASTAASGMRPSPQSIVKPKPVVRPVSAAKPYVPPRNPLATRPAPKPTKAAQGWQQPGPVDPKLAPAPATAPVPARDTSLDYRGLASYGLGSERLNADFGGQRREIAAQLEANQRQYGTEVKEWQEDSVEAAEGSEDQFARSGGLRSGARERADADRFEEFNSVLASIEDQYGSGASARLNAALERLAEQERLEREQLELTAREEWAQAFPAAPMQEEVAPAPVVAAPAASAAKRPSFPGAKTFTDAAGNLRQIGTGKILRTAGQPAPAPVPAPRPRR